MGYTLNFPGKDTNPLVQAIDAIAKQATSPYVAAITHRTDDPDNGAPDVLVHQDYWVHGVIGSDGPDLVQVTPFEEDKDAPAEAAQTIDTGLIEEISYY